VSERAPHAPSRGVVGPAVLLAVGVVAWEQALHAARGVAPPGPVLAHLAVDSAFALPLAVFAITIGKRASRRTGVRAIVTAVLFSAALIPAVGAHQAIHPLLLRQAGLAPGHVEHVIEGSSTLSHGVHDSLYGLPAALFVAFLALRAGFRLRLPRRQKFAALATVLAFAGLPTAGRAAPAVEPFATPLPIPPVETSPVIALTAAQTQQQILPGNTTTMWTFNGSFPGPTIRRPSGEPTLVTVANQLPAWAGSITVHHHGNHSLSVDDGQPSRYLIPPGGSRQYSYGFVENKAPERGAFQWYHDHMMGATARNDWMGLSGMVILDDPSEATINAALPNGARDVPLMVVDRSFDAANQIPYTFDPDGVLGDVILVNGAAQPYFEVADVKYRLRILNASNTRSYDFTLSNGIPMVQIATESGLLPAPISRSHIMLGPAQRAEVIVDFAGSLGQNIVLMNKIGFTRNLSQAMQFRVTRHESDASRVPTTLRPAPVFGALPLGATRLWNFGRNTGNGEWTINGKGFDPNRIDARPKLGTVERWIFVNTSDADHIVHIHDVDWQIVSRVNLDASKPVQGLKGEPGLHESFRLVPNEIVTIQSKFTDHLGIFVFHCHILEHEDFSMMDQFRVVPRT
jgi:FtsP/CotA-like multicopper oxidase with cupredoxin domain